MRSLIGLLWALGGGAAGALLGFLAGLAIANLTNTSSRDGAAGCLVVGIALLAGIIGVITGVVLYGRSAPAGMATSFVGSSTMAVVALIAVVAGGAWAFLALRETPVTYGGAMADLLLEVRMKADAAPSADSTGWLSVEVHTPNTRPEGDVSWSQVRTDGGYRIVPVTQGPLSRTRDRVVVVNLAGRQLENFSPPMPRVPDPTAGWSEWYQAKSVEPPFGVVPPAPLRSMFELRYRVRVYGQ